MEIAWKSITVATGTTEANPKADTVAIPLRHIEAFIICFPTNVLDMGIRIVPQGGKAIPATEDRWLKYPGGYQLTLPYSGFMPNDAIRVLSFNTKVSDQTFHIGVVCAPEERPEYKISQALSGLNEQIGSLKDIISKLPIGKSGEGGRPWPG